MLAEFVTMEGVPVNPFSKTPIPWHITRRPIMGRSERRHFALLSLSMATFSQLNKNTPFVLLGLKAI